MGIYRGYLCGARCGRPRLLLRRVAPPRSPHLIVYEGVLARERPRAPLPHLCHHVGMDTSSTPYVSPVLAPETMAALMLRYVEGQEEVAYLYARALMRRLTADLSVHDALRLARDIVTEVTNDIGIFEEEGVADQIDVALRQLIDRVEAELAD